MGVHSEGFQRAIADFVCFHCPLVASAEAKSPACGKERLCLQDQLRGRAHLARQCVSSWWSSLGAHLRMRKVTGRDASLPAPLLGASLELSARKTVGALPPTRELRPLTPQGGFPLDPFFAPQLERISTAICFCSFFSLQPNRFMPQCRHDLRPENLLRKHHRRRIVARMERNPSFPLHIMVKDQLNPLLLVKPQSQRRQAP